MRGNFRSQVLCGSLILFANLFCLTGCKPGPVAEITGSDAVIKRPLAGKTQAVAYLTLQNNSNTAKTLTQVSSEIAGAIELHTHIRTGDRLRMEHLSEIVVPAQSELVFSPGGHHLMLFRVGNLSTTDAKLNFGFSDNTNYTLDFSVEGY